MSFAVHSNFISLHRCPPLQCVSHPYIPLVLSTSSETASLTRLLSPLLTPGYSLISGNSKVNPKYLILLADFNIGANRYILSSITLFWPAPQTSYIPLGRATGSWYSGECPVLDLWLRGKQAYSSWPEWTRSELPISQPLVCTLHIICKPRGLERLLEGPV